MNKKILIIVACILAILGALCGIYLPDSEMNDTISTVQNMVIDEIKVINNQSTTEIPELTENDEQTVEVQETESEVFEEQGEIAYNGSDKVPEVNVGEYAGLTYYSQMDNRWKNKMYSIIGDSNQTIGNSGCGPTSAAMVVSSIKGVISPETMANLYVQHGYRSTNNGTYWSAFRWTADAFNIDYKETSSLDTAIKLVKDNNYVIVSCGNGLFTYGGHFIVIVGVEGNTLKIYDPYLYSGKFNTSTRRGKANVDGNTVYVSIDNFRNYANARGYFCFKNDRTEIKENTTATVVTNNITSNVTNVNYNVKVTANSGLNIRNGASTSYSRVGGYFKNTVVTILAESNGWGKTDKGWICLSYTSKTISDTTIVQNSSKFNSYTTGTYKVTASVLNVRTGPSTKYSAKTYYQLTANARKQNKNLGNYYTNGYRKGTMCTVSKISGNWGLTPSGWICLGYCQKIK